MGKKKALKKNSREADSKDMQKWANLASYENEKMQQRTKVNKLIFF